MLLKRNGLALCIFGFLGIFYTGGAGAQSRAAVNVAVLPLTNSSNDAASDYFPDGLTDEIASALTRVPGLAVVARSSIYRYRGKDQDPKLIGPVLKTDYFVLGTAQKSGANLRMSIRLMKADGSAPRWTKDYDQPLASIFDVEEDIALRVAAALNHPVTLPRGEHLLRSRAKDFAVYDDFLRAKVLARGRGARALADASMQLETVLTRDPDFEPAAAMIAYEYALTPLFAPALRGGRPDEERKITDRLIPRAEAFALRAVALDPKDATAFVGLGYVRLVQRNMIAAEDAFKEALRLDPNQADGLHGFSQFLAAMGKISQSLAMRVHLQDIEPSIVNYTADTAEIYWLAGDTDKAIAMLQPFRPGRTLELALIESASGRYRDAAAALREMPASNWPDGMLEKAANLLDTAPARNAPDSLPKLGSLGFTYLHAGAPERVLEYYEDEVKGGYFQPISTTWFWHPSYAAVRKTERFKRLARDLGLVDYWRARGWPQWCHPVGANDFACD
jgi:TolB-like protein